MHDNITGTMLNFLKFDTIIKVNMLGKSHYIYINIFWHILANINYIFIARNHFHPYMYTIALYTSCVIVYVKNGYLVKNRKKSNTRLFELITQFMRFLF